jgi:hypothetical protein
MSVVAAFYAFHQDAGRGPLRNPVPERRDPQTGQHFGAHHNPLDPFRQTTRGAYRAAGATTVPRSLPTLRSMRCSPRSPATATGR